MGGEAREEQSEGVKTGMQRANTEKEGGRHEKKERKRSKLISKSKRKEEKDKTIKM